MCLGLFLKTILNYFLTCKIVFYFGERRNVFKNICQTGYRFLFFGVYIGFGHGPNSCSPNPEPLSWPKWNELNLGSIGIDY